MICQPVAQCIECRPIEKLVFYTRNPRKNDAAVDRMCSSIREFGFKIPVLARSDGEVVDGHLRLKAAYRLGSWPGGDTTGIPVILCDEWTPAQVKAFRLMVNRSVTWADWDETLLALELQELKESDFDLDLTGFDPGEIDGLLALEDDERANATPPLPESPVSRPGDLWLLGPHRVLCGDATSAETVARPLAERKPRLMVTDPPYGIELDSEWRDRAILAVLLGCGLRRSEVAALTLARVQQRDGRWCIVDLVGKHSRVRTVPMPTWVKVAIDAWTSGAGLAEGRIFRRVNRGDKVQGHAMSEKVVWQMLQHDCRRSWAKLCRAAGGELEQIQLLLGHASVQTKERYLGTKQDLVNAPNDAIKLKVAV